MRNSFCPEQEKLPVYINNFNRLSTPSKLAAWLEQIPYVNIIFIDNASTYEPLLKWYAGCKYTVVRKERNLGHTSFFTPIQPLRRSLFDLAPEWFVLTDADIMPIEDCPHHAIEVFYSLMMQFTGRQKVGFGLETGDIPDHYPLKADVIAWEKKFIGRQICDIAVDAHIDTTFALYKKSRWQRENQSGAALRTLHPYVARHTPWYVDPKNLDTEEIFYLKTAGDSSYWGTKLAGII